MMLKKITNLLILVLVLILMFSSTALASIADWSDEEADKQTQEQLKEQEKEDEENFGKSSNNFLSNLEIKGYTLVPEFDKQTVIYSVEAKTGDTIDITATPEDERAEVTGTGKIKVEENENIYIKVKAENGMERTYVISTNQLNNKENINQTNTTDKNTYTAEETSQKVSEVKSNNKINNIVILVGIAIVIIIILIIFPRRKRGRRH